MMTADLLDQRYGPTAQSALLSGNQALVRLALTQRRLDQQAGLNTAGFVSGYRGSPLGGLDREFTRAQRFLAAEHVVFRPGINEDLAATAVWGSQQLGFFPGARYDGVFAMWYGKGPGVDRSMDVIRHANAAGTQPHGGVLLLVGDDNGASSSTLPHQSEQNLISAGVPLLSPAGLAEFIRFGLLGWAMSRYSGAWTGFKCQTDIVECTATIPLADTLPTIIHPALAHGESLSARWPDGSHAMERRLLQDKLHAVTRFAAANQLDQQTTAPPRARFGIVASGKAWLDLQGALTRLGIDTARAEQLSLRLYKVGLVWPLEPTGIATFANGLSTVLVVEEKRGVIEDQMRTQLYNAPADARPRIFGKTGPSGDVLLPAWGEIEPVSVARAILAAFPDLAADLADAAQRLAASTTPRPTSIPGVQREPYFCSGCPHSISTRVPDGSRASTGIGCHMMIIGNPDRATATFTQMGGEGVAWTGMAPFTDENHIFVNIGDGTYFHSGILAIRAAIAAGVNATYKILYNDAVAMTGGQKLDGTLTVPQVVAQVLAEGAAKVAVVAEDPSRHRGHLPTQVLLRDRDQLDAVQRDLRAVPGVTVMVFDQVCAAEKRRRRKRGALPTPPARAFINDLVCEGCGDCSAVSNCISIEPVETDLGRKRRINQSSCNIDLSCVKGFCPSFVTVTGGLARPARATAADPAALAALPTPSRPAADQCDILLAGIGGTGVITVAAIMAEAAQQDGWHVSLLDQTGLAQKNGAVVSHLRLRLAHAAVTPTKIGLAEADLLLGFDMVVAAGDTALKAVAPGRTQALVNSHVTPTAAFVRDTGIDLQEAGLRHSLRTALGDRLALVDATTAALAQLGDSVAANMWLLGNAWQRGLVPLSHAALMEAITLNGAAVEMNLMAFAWGRLAANATPAQPAAPASFAELVATRAAHLQAYQNAAYAQRYRDLVARAAEAEAAVAPGRTALARAVANSAFRLMAYKDEYEVARLHLDPRFRSALARQFSPGARFRYHLAPPLLSFRRDARTGAPAKISVGRWIEPAFRLLAGLKSVRGQWYDPFGWTAERRAERQAPHDYEALLATLLPRLSAANHSKIVEIAGLADTVRGFGPVKRQAAARAAAQQAALLHALAD